LRARLLRSALEARVVVELTAAPQPGEEQVAAVVVAAAVPVAATAQVAGRLAEAEAAPPVGERPAVLLSSRGRARVVVAELLTSPS
jgi:hypothetical protein